jgi:hypothetical protein
MDNVTYFKLSNAIAQSAKCAYTEAAESGLHFRQGESFLVTTVSRRALITLLPSGVNRSDSEADHSYLSTGEI